MGAAPRADAGTKAWRRPATRLQCSAVHRETHHDHLIDILKHLQGLGSRELGVDVGGPVDLLQEGVGGLRQLLRRVIDLVSMSRLRTQHGEHASGCRHGSRTASRRRHEGVAQAREDHQGHDEHRASLPVRHVVQNGQKGGSEMTRG